MSIITKASAKQYFTTGAYPTQGNFADTIDSYLGLGETTLQTVSGQVNFAAGIKVSGNNIGTAATKNLATVIVDDGSGNLTIGIGGVTSAMLASTAVSAGTYAAPTITINAVGQIISAVGGSSGVFASIQTQTFAASGTYTPNSKMIYCAIEVYGGGGGGGGVSSTNPASAGGGGAGGYAKLIATKATIGASQIVTIGTGGTGGTNTGGDGSPGGTTSLGSLVSASGGNGGNGRNTSNPSGGQPGGSGSSGTINLVGNSGGSSTIAAVNNMPLGGVGGATTLGGTAPAVANSSAAGGNATANSGSGGGGATSVGTGEIGGNGAAGFVIITEYCSQ